MRKGDNCTSGIHNTTPNSHSHPETQLETSPGPRSPATACPQACLGRSPTRPVLQRILRHRGCHTHAVPTLWKAGLGLAKGQKCAPLQNTTDIGPESCERWLILTLQLPSAGPNLNKAGKCMLDFYRSRKSGGQRCRWTTGLCAWKTSFLPTETQCQHQPPSSCFLLGSIVVSKTRCGAEEEKVAWRWVTHLPQDAE